MQVAPCSVADFEPVLEGKNPSVELQDSDFSSEFSYVEYWQATSCPGLLPRAVRLDQ